METNWEDSIMVRHIHETLIPSWEEKTNSSLLSKLWLRIWRSLPWLSQVVLHRLWLQPWLWLWQRKKESLQIMIENTKWKILRSIPCEIREWIFSPSEQKKSLEKIYKQTCSDIYPSFVPTKCGNISIIFFPWNNWIDSFFYVWIVSTLKTLSTCQLLHTSLHPKGCSQISAALWNYLYIWFLYLEKVLQSDRLELLFYCFDYIHQKNTPTKAARLTCFFTGEEIYHFWLWWKDLPLWTILNVIIRYLYLRLSCFIVSLDHHPIWNDTFF